MIRDGDSQCTDNTDNNVTEISTQRLTTGPASSQVNAEIAGATHRGNVRINNEDHYLALRFQRSLATLCTNLEEDSVEQSFDETGCGWYRRNGRRRHCESNRLVQAG
jgi:hypothetical protein